MSQKPTRFKIVKHIIFLKTVDFHLGDNSLILAAKNGKTDMVTILLEHGSDISANDNDGTVVASPLSDSKYLCTSLSIPLIICLNGHMRRGELNSITKFFILE